MGKAIALALPRGLNIAAGWVFLLGTLGFMNSDFAWIAALGLFLWARQLSSGNALRTAPFTFSFCGSIVVIFCAVWCLRGDAGVETLGAAGTLSWPNIRAGELWRIPAILFLHHDWGHLQSNVIALAGLGLLLEPVIGTWALGQACLFTMVTSSVTGLLYQSGGYGASGVAFGLVGVCLARPFRDAPDAGRRFDWAWALIALWFLVDFPYSQNSPGIGVAAHFGGLAGGVWFGCLWPGDRVAAPLKGTPARRWILATTLVIVLVAAEGLNPRWQLDWHARIARHAEQAGDLKAAGYEWNIVKSLASPDEPIDAAKLDGAARYWGRRGDVARARRIMSDVSPTMGSEEYNDLGAYQAFVNPPDERRALESWEQSLTLNPHSAEVLDRMAHVRLFPNDSTLYSPIAAVYLARCAVEQDRFETPDYIHTLSLAEDRSGNRVQAIRLMKRALALAPEDSTEYLEDLAAMEEAVADSSHTVVALR